MFPWQTSRANSLFPSPTETSRLIFCVEPKLPLLVFFFVLGSGNLFLFFLLSFLVIFVFMGIPAFDFANMRGPVPMNDMSVATNTNALNLQMLLAASQCVSSEPENDDYLGIYRTYYLFSFFYIFLKVLQ